MSSTISRQGFLTELRASERGQVRVDDQLRQRLAQALPELAPERRAALIAQVEGLANQAGVIRGPKLEQLFGLLDGLVRDNRPGVLTVTQRDPASGIERPTASGRALAALRASAEQALTVDLAGVRDIFADAELHLDRLTPAAWGRLAAAGVSRDKLTALAGPDGVIRGQSEATLVYGLLDSLDYNGSAYSFNAAARSLADGTVRRERPGLVLDELAAARLDTHALARDGFVDQHADGAFDLAALSQAQRAELARLGLGPEALVALGGANARAEGRRGAEAVFAALRRLAPGQRPETLATSVPLPVGQAVTAADRSAAGKALELLQGCYARYAPARAYADLQAALRVDPDAVPALGPLAVPHLVQTGDDCYDVATRMIRRYDATLPGLLVDAGESHCPAVSKDRHGSVSGLPADFAAARAYIDACLAADRPAFIGLAHRAGYPKGNAEKVTNHFMVVTGRGVDAEGRLYYTYNDSGDSGRHATGRLYVDAASGVLFRPALDNPGYVAAGHSLQLSRVRPYRDLDFAAITGRAPRTPW